MAMSAAPDGRPTAERSTEIPRPSRAPATTPQPRSTCRRPCARPRTPAALVPIMDLQERPRLLRGLRGGPRGRPADRPQRDHRADRPLRLRQVDPAALPQPDERPDPRRPGRGHDHLPRQRPLRARTSTSIEVRRRIGMVFQKPNPFPKSIYDNIAYGPRVLGIEGRHGRHRRGGPAPARRCGTRSRTSSSRARSALSGGQQQRLCIARCIAVQPDVILMDEPCSALDPIATAKIEDLMQELAQRLHDRDRHAQHAAGGARLRPHRVLHRRGRRARACGTAGWSSSTRPSRSSPTPKTRAPRTTSAASSDSPHPAVRPPGRPRRRRRPPCGGRRRPRWWPGSSAPCCGTA